MRLKDKVALITGAASGIGRAVADLFVSEGATVYAGDLATSAAPQAAGARALVLDVTSEDAWQRAIDTVIEATGRLDVLVNAAGTVVYERLHELDAREWARSIAVNQSGVFLGMREAVGVMRRQKAGSIVNVAPAREFVTEGANYALQACVGALRAMSRSAAVTYAEDGVRVNAVLPGLVVAAPATRRAGTPLDVALGCLYLASDESGFVNGSALAIDGGNPQQ